jgi:hypothetical protein
MTGEIKHKAEEHFQSDKLINNKLPYQIIINTYALSGVRLTLTVANKMFLLEPIWWELTKIQGIKWILRIGQTASNVFAWRLFTTGE